MRKLRKLVVLILAIALCMPIHALALDGISDDCNVDEVIAVLVHDGIHHKLNAKQVNELELCGFESFVEKYDLSVSRLEVSQVTPRNQPGDINYVL